MIRSSVLSRAAFCLALALPAPLAGQHPASFWYSPHPLPGVEEASDRLRFLTPHLTPVSVEGNRFNPEGGYSVARADVSRAGVLLSFRRNGAGEPSEFHSSWGSRFSASGYTPGSDNLVVSIDYREIAYFQIWTVPSNRGADAWCVEPMHHHAGRSDDVLCVDSVHNAEVLVDALATLVQASGGRLIPPFGMWAVPAQGVKTGKHVRQSVCEVSQVDWNGPPAQAGAQIGDILYAIDGKPCTAGGDFLTAFRQAAGGALEGGELHADLLRKGKHLAVTLNYPELEAPAQQLPQEDASQIAASAPPALAPQPPSLSTPPSTQVLTLASTASRPLPLSVPASTPFRAPAPSSPAPGLVAASASTPLPLPTSSSTPPRPPVPSSSAPGPPTVTASSPLPLPASFSTPPRPPDSSPAASAPLALPTAGPAGFRLGVQVRPVTVADVPAFRLSAPKGLVVVSVEKGGMAEAMQIQAGDIFLSVNGTDLANLQVFAQAIQVGGAKTFQVWHNGQLSELVVPLSL